MNRFIEVLLTVILLISFMLPWHMNIADMSKHSGLEILLFSLVGGFVGVSHGRYHAFLYIMVGFMLALTLVLCIKILLNRSGNSWRLRTVIFFLITGSFFIPLIFSSTFEIPSVAPFLESLYSAFSFVQYGYYTALFSAAGLLFYGMPRRKNKN